MASSEVSEGEFKFFFSFLFLTIIGAHWLEATFLPISASVFIWHFSLCASVSNSPSPFSYIYKILFVNEVIFRSWRDVNFSEILNQLQSWSVLWKHFPALPKELKWRGKRQEFNWVSVVTISQPFFILLLNSQEKNITKKDKLINLCCTLYNANL